MKNTLTICLLCLGIGFGAAWLLKPDATNDEESAAQPETSPPPRVASKSDRTPSSDQATKSDRSETENRSVVVNGEEVDPNRNEARAEFRRGRDRFRDMFETSRKAKQEAEIQKLVDRLGLTDGQADQLRAYYEKNRADLASLMEGGEDWSKAKEFSSKLRGEGLDKALAEILTDEQRTAYDEMKQRDRQNQVEARAYDEFGKIQLVLDLTPEQKDQVFEILHEDASTSIDQNKDANAIVSTFAEGFGVDAGALGISSGIASIVQVQIDKAAEGEQPNENPGEWMQAVQETRQREIDQKVERLAPVLDDRQEETYRNHLESQGGGILGGILGRAGNIDVQVESTQQPAQNNDE